MKIYLGGAKTGKTNKILSNAIDDALKGTKVYLLVPETKAYMYEYMISKRLNNSNIFIEVLTFSRLGYYILKNTNYKNVMYIDDEIRKIYIKKIIGRVSLELLGKDKNIEDISELISKIKKNGLTKDDILEKYNSLLESINSNNSDISNIDTSILDIKINEIITILDEYDKELGNNKDIEQKNEILNIAIKNSDYFKDSNIYVDGFDGFTLMQFNILENIFDKVNDAYISLTLDKLTTNNEIFLNNRETLNTLLKIMQKSTSNIEYEVFEDIHVENNALKIFNTVYTKNKEVEDLFNSIKDSDEYINIYEYENKSDEIKWVAYNVFIDLKDGTNVEDIQVIMNDFSKHKNELKKEFSKYNIEVDIREEKSIKNNLLVRYIYLLLSSSLVNVESIVEFLKLDLFTDLGIELLDVYRLEKYIKLWDINNKRIRTEFKYGSSNENFENVVKVKNIALLYIDSFIKSLLDENVEGNEDNNEEIDITKEFNKHSNKIGKKRLDSRYISEKIYIHLKENKIFDKIYLWINDKENNEDLKSEYIQVINNVNGILDKLSKLGKVSLKEYLELFMSLVEKNALKPIIKNNTLNVTDLKNVNEFSKITYILSFEEDITPKNSSRVGIISEKENEILKTANINIYDTYEELDKKNDILLYHALMSSTKKLILSYSKYNDITKSELLPSSYLSKIYKFNVKKNEVIGNFNIFREIEKGLELNVSVDNVLKYIPDNEEIFKELYIYYNNEISKYYEILENDKKNINEFEENNDIKSKIVIYEKLLNSILKNSNMIKIYNEVQKLNIIENLSQDLIDKIYKKDINMTVSRLEEYARFPFAYHLKYILKINEERTFKIGSVDTGSFIHEVIEKVFDNITSKEIKSYNISNKENFSDLEMLSKINKEDKVLKENIYKYRERIESEVEKQVEKALEDKKYEILVASPKYRRLTEKLINDLKDICLNIAETIRLSNYEIFGNEIHIGIKKEDGKENYPAKIINSKGRNIKIYGKIDRIDDNLNNLNDIRVIDYKSSGKELEISKIVSGLQLQLIVYAKIMEELLKKDNSGLLYFKANKSINTFSKRPISQNLKSDPKLTGLLVGDKEILKDMDTTLDENNKEKLKSKILKAGFTSKGDISKATNIISKEEYKKLEEMAEKAIEDIVNNILKGDISITPYKYIKNNKKESDGLDFDPYGIIHRFGKDNNFRYIYDKNKEEILSSFKEDCKDDEK